jgi:hypothetical protein
VPRTPSDSSPVFKLWQLWQFRRLWQFHGASDGGDDARTCPGLPWITGDDGDSPGDSGRLWQFVVALRSDELSS